MRAFNRFVTVVLFLGVNLSIIAHAVDTTIRSYPIPKHGVLELAVPPSWIDSFQQPSGDLPPTIQFVPKTGTQFQLLITPVWSVKPGENINEPTELKALINDIGRTLLPTAVEKDLNVLELQRGDSRGYYYILTDKAPKPGEYQYMAQGAIGIGDLQLSFTLLLNAKDSDEQRSALDMLIGAKQRK